MSRWVVNVKVVGRKGCDVFVGRPSKWGNPFKIGRDGTREEVVRKYRAYMESSPDARLEAEELRGKVLGCYCAPKLCHADVLTEVANTPVTRSGKAE